MREPRTAVMILVEATWEDPSGALHTLPACMEDRSAGGACIRIQKPIEVGSKLRVQWRWDHFSGTTRYCRNDGLSYLVGIQRDRTTNLTSHAPIPPDLKTGDKARNSTPPVSTSNPQPAPAHRKTSSTVITAAEAQSARAQIKEAANGTDPRPPLDASPGTNSAGQPLISQSPNLEDHEPTELHSNKPPQEQEKEAGKERKPMQRKWFDLAPWHRKQENLTDHGNGSGRSRDRVDPGHRAPKTPAPPAEAALPQAGTVSAICQIEFLPIEDIYHAAGIVNARRGYSIKKVVEMLHSEHIRALPNEMKRAAVVMALDAAGIPITEVLQDAKARQAALESYETEQKKQVEAEWARKAQENIQIEAELERTKAHHMARINRNLEGVAREKAMLNDWLTKKSGGSPAHF